MPRDRLLAVRHRIEDGRPGSSFNQSQPPVNQGEPSKRPSFWHFAQEPPCFTVLFIYFGGSGGHPRSEICTCTLFRTFHIGPAPSERHWSEKSACASSSEGPAAPAAVSYWMLN
jgi:hypothetical protein